MTVYLGPDRTILTEPPTDSNMWVYPLPLDIAVHRSSIQGAAMTPDKRTHTKVYVLTSGRLSESHIEKIFSSREKGEAWIKKFDGTKRRKHYNDPYEAELDPDPEKIPQDAYACMGLNTGELLLYRLEVFDAPSRARLLNGIGVRKKATSRNIPEDLIYMYFDHRDKEMAIKVLSETRAKLQAQYLEEDLIAGYYSKNDLIYYGR